MWFLSLTIYKYRHWPDNYRVKLVLILSGFVGILNQSDNASAIPNGGQRKSRYDNASNFKSTNNLVPFHTQMCDEGPSNEENEKVDQDNQPSNKLELGKANSLRVDPKYHKIEKLDLKEIKSFLPPVAVSKHGKFGRPYAWLYGVSSFKDLTKIQNFILTT